MRTGRPRSSRVWRTVAGVTERLCSHCQTWKPHTKALFTLDNRNESGLGTICKQCKAGQYIKKGPPPRKPRPEVVEKPSSKFDRATLLYLQRIVDTWR